MGQLVFQANSGGQTNLVGQNTASTFNLNIPLANGTLVSTGDTATVTSAMISGPVTTAKGGTGLTSFTSGGAVYATSTSALTTGTLPTSAGGTNLTSFTSGGVVYASSSSSLTTGSALTFDGTNFSVTNGSVSVINTGVFQFGTGFSNYISGNTTLNYMQFYVNASEQMRLTSTGLGIGTSSISSKLQVHNTNSEFYVFDQFTKGLNNVGSGWKYIMADQTNESAIGTNAGNLIFYNATSATERARIDSNGSFFVGSTNVVPDAGVCLLSPGTTSSPRIHIGHTSGTASGNPYANFYYSSTAIGSITQSGTTAVLYNVTSDQRLKENVVDAPEFGSVIDSIQVRSFDWKTDNTHQRAGFIAQELVTVAPEAVHQPADPEEMMAVDYSKLVPMLVKEIQSLRKRLAAAGI